MLFYFSMFFWSAALFFIVYDFKNLDAQQTSPLAKLLQYATGKSLQQLELLNFRFHPSLSNKDLYCYWFSLTLMSAIGIIWFVNSVVLAGLLAILACILPRIAGEYLVTRQTWKFESEFLRFIQLLKSRQLLNGAIEFAIPDCIQTMLFPSGRQAIAPNQQDKRQAEEKDAVATHLSTESFEPDQQLATGALLASVSSAARNNKKLSLAFAAEATKFGEVGLQFKSLSLFLAILKAIEQSGQVGATLDHLEHRIQSDLEIQHELRAKTAGAKWEMGFMAIVPQVALVAYAFLMPDSVGAVFTSTFGQVLISIAVLFITMGISMGAKTLRIQV